MQGIKGLLQWLWAGRSLSLQSPSGWQQMELLGTAPTAAGISVTPHTALHLSTVWACVRLISESIASLPLHVYRRVDDKRRERVVGSPQHRLLHDEPNELMTSFVFREVLSSQLLLWGNAYAAILRNGAAAPTDLLPVPSSNVAVRRSERIGLVYDFRMPDGKVYSLGQADVLHIPGLSPDGICGISPVQYAAQSIGLGLAAEQFGASFFGSGSMPSGVITLQGKLNKEQAQAFRDAWQSTYGGLSNAQRTAVLFEGAKWERITIPPNDAQFLETRKFQVSEIARWYRIPPHMVGDLDRATFANIEHQQLEFVIHTLRPWLVRFEQEFNRKLFPSSTEGRPSDLYAEFSVEGLLRGDIKSRSDYYVKGRQWGWLSANDIREKENMEPIDDGDVYLTPLNMVPAGSAPADGADAPQDPADTAPSGQEAQA